MKLRRGLFLIEKAIEEKSIFHHKFNRKITPSVYKGFEIIFLTIKK